MLKLLLALVISLVAAVPATVIYFGILTALKPLLDKLRLAQHENLTAKSQRI